MDNPDSTLFRPGDPLVPCFAVLGYHHSPLKLVNLENGRSSCVELSDQPSLGIVTNDGEVYVVTWNEILKLHGGGRKTILPIPRDLSLDSKVGLFQKKIYIIEPEERERESMLFFDPADNSLTDDLPGCGLGDGFCTSATGDFIYAMGGYKTEARAMKYDPPTIKWEGTAPMRKKRRYAAAATLNGKIYVIGGMDHGASVEYYNPGNNSWTEISNMNAGRAFFSACVVGDRLYAVGGEPQTVRFCRNSIEVYNKNKWTLVTRFRNIYEWRYSCFWPHGSHQSDFIHPKDLPFPESAEKMYCLLRRENFLETKRSIGSKTEEIEYAGCKFSLSEGALTEEKEVMQSARVGIDKKKGMPDITPTFECNPPVRFEKPVSMTMRTCISAPAGKEISAFLFTRDHPGGEWTQTQQLRLGRETKSISRFVVSAESRSWQKVPT